MQLSVVSLSIKHTVDSTFLEIHCSKVLHLQASSFLYWDVAWQKNADAEKRRRDFENRTLSTLVNIPKMGRIFSKLSAKNHQNTEQTFCVFIYLWHSVWKFPKKSHSTLRAKRATHTRLFDQICGLTFFQSSSLWSPTSFLKNGKMTNFLDKKSCTGSKLSIHVEKNWVLLSSHGENWPQKSVSM